MKSTTIEVTVKAPISRVWEYWNNPEHIKEWAFASDTWECPHAENDLRVGGAFLTRMAAKDGTSSFDITGAYTEVVQDKHIAYTMTGGRKVVINFTELDGGLVKVVETFDLENQNTEERQREGWQAILNNFKALVEEQ